MRSRSPVSSSATRRIHASLVILPWVGLLPFATLAPACSSSSGDGGTLDGSTLPLPSSSGTPPLPGLDGSLKPDAPTHPLDATADHQTPHDGGPDTKPEATTPIDGTTSKDGPSSGDTGPEPSDASDGGAPGDAATDALSLGDGGADARSGDAAAEASVDGGDAGSDAAVDTGTPLGTGVVILLATGPKSAGAGALGGTLGGTFHPGGSWSTVELTALSSDDLSLAIVGGKGVGLVHYENAGNSSDALNDALVFATWNAGAWEDFLPVASGVVTRSQPAIAASAGATYAQAVFQNESYSYEYVLYDPSVNGWSDVSPVSNGGTASYGPVAASIAALGPDATLLFVDGASPDVNYVADQDYTDGWQARADVTTTAESYTVGPTLVALTGTGPELMGVFVDASANVYTMTRTLGVWSIAQLPLATTNEHVALAALADGGAILAFAGQDGNLYAATYTAGPGGGWSTVTAVPGAANVVGSPALALGVGQATAELAYVSSTGGTNEAYHARLITGAWTIPVDVVGPDVTHVAIASQP